MALILLWIICRMLLKTHCHGIRGNNIGSWRQGVANLLVFLTMAAPSYSSSAWDTYSVRLGTEDSSVARDTTNKIYTSHGSAWITSLTPSISPAVLQLTSQSSASDTQRSTVAAPLDSVSSSSASYKPEIISFLQTSFFIHSTPFLSSSNKHTQDLILPSHTAPPDALKATDLTDIILKPDFSTSLTAGHLYTQQFHFSSVISNLETALASVSANVSSEMGVDVGAFNSELSRTMAHSDDVIKPTFPHHTQTASNSMPAWTTVHPDDVISATFSHQTQTEISSMPTSITAHSDDDIDFTFSHQNQIALNSIPAKTMANSYDVISSTFSHQTQTALYSMPTRILALSNDVISSSFRHQSQTASLSVQATTTTHSDDVIRPTFSHQIQTVSRTTDMINSASTFSSEWVDQQNKSRNSAVLSPSATADATEASHNIRQADDHSTTPQDRLPWSGFTSAQPPFVIIEPTRVHHFAETQGVLLSGIHSTPDGARWSLTGITSLLSPTKLLLATQLTSSPSAGPHPAVTSSELPVNPTTNLMVAMDDKEWAVPVVAALASVTLLAVVALLIVCGHHFRTKRRLRRTTYSSDGQHLPTRNHPQSDQQKPKQVGNLYSHVHKNGYGAPGIDRKDPQKSPPARGYGGLTDGSRDNFEMSELEGSGRARMTEVDSVDNGEEWTTKYVQETRMHDYGVVDNRAPYRGQKVTGVVEAGAPRLKAPRGPAPASPMRNPANRFPQMSTSLSFEEARLGDALHRAKNPAPPLKPKRVYAPQPQPHLLRGAGFENKGFLPEPQSGRNSGSGGVGVGNDSGVSMDQAEAEYHVKRGKSHAQGNTHAALDVTWRKQPSGDKRGHRILKCASYDESRLAADAKPQGVKAGPTRKISTVSEPAREYLVVPEESSIAKSRWMYPSVDDLAHTDHSNRASDSSLEGSGIEQEEQSVKEDERQVGIASLDGNEGENYSERNKEKKSVHDMGSHDPDTTTTTTPTKPASDFIFPIISKATKKILEVRNSRKLEQTISNDSGDRFESHNSHGAVRSPELDTPLTDRPGAFGSRSPPSPIKYGRGVPKIVLTNETEDETGEDGVGEELRQATPSPSRAARRIARANNPFLIEVDKPASKKSEKFRRSSAPSMPFNLDPNVRLATTLGMTRSSSGELLRAPSVDASWGGTPTTTSSWSRQFYDLVNRIPENDPYHSRRVKKMIDDRYDALFGRRFPDAAAADQHEGGGERSARLAIRKIKASSLDRDSSLTHSLISYLTEREIEPQSSASVFTPDFRRHSGEPWRPHFDLPVGTDSKLRKSLAHGTDGYDNLASKAAKSVQDGPDKSSADARLRKEGGVIPQLGNASERSTRTDERIHFTGEQETKRQTGIKAESSESKTGLREGAVSEGSHVNAELISRREVPFIFSHRLDRVPESKSSPQGEFLKPTGAPDVSYVERKEQNDTTVKSIEDKNTDNTSRIKPRPGNFPSGETTVDKLMSSRETTQETLVSFFELPPSKIEVDTAARVADDIPALTMKSPPSGRPRKLKAADDTHHQRLSAEERADHWEAPHDSTPSSRDVSVVDTSEEEEEGKDMEFEIDDFDSLLSSTV